MPNPQIPDSPSPRRRDSLWLLLDLLAVQLAIAVIFGVLARSGSFWHSSILGRKVRLPVEMPGMVLAVLVSVLVVLPAVRRVTAGSTAGDLGLRRPADFTEWRSSLCLTGFGLGIAALATLLAPELVMAVFARLGLENRGDLWVFLLLVAPLFAGLSEELIYRGVMQSSLAKIDEGYGTLCALLAFLALHAYQGWAAVLIYVLPVALAFTAARKTNKSLWPLVLAHFMVDALIFGGLFVLRERPDLRIVICLGALAGALVMVCLTRTDLRALASETRAWVQAVRRASLRRHLPWALALFLGSSSVQLAVGAASFPAQGAVAGLLAGIYTWRWTRSRAIDRPGTKVGGEG